MEISKKNPWAPAAQRYRLGWKFQKILLARLRREDASLSILQAEIIAGWHRRKRLRRKGTGWGGNFKKISLGVCGARAQAGMEISKNFACAPSARRCELVNFAGRNYRRLLQPFRRKGTGASVCGARVQVGVEISKNLRAFGVKVGCLQVEN
jgi:hypothetical protein